MADVTQGVASAAGSANPVGAAVQAATAIAQTVSGIIDQTKRRQFEQALASLSNQQQNELNNKLLAARTESERLQILSSSIVSYAAQNAQAAQKKQTVIYVIVGVMMLGLLTVAVIMGKRKK